MASERESGKKASTTITLSSGLSAQELDAIVAENRTQRVKAEPAAPAAAAAPAPASADEGALEVLDESEFSSLIEEDLEELGGLGVAPEPTDNSLFDRDMRDLSSGEKDGSES